MNEPKTSTNHYNRIEDYGLIGDLHTVALVGMDGSIDFCCFPEFDSPSMFASILDHEKGGYFKMAPLLQEARHRQHYLPDTNVLITKFRSRHGVAEVSDFMALEGRASHDAYAHHLVRRAKTVRGEVPFRMICAPRFNYARSDHRLEINDREAIFESRGPDKTAIRLRSPVPLRAHNGDAVAEFTLRSGRSAAFVLEQLVEGTESPAESPSFVADAFKDTVNFWRRWVARSSYTGRWRESVNRSALTLKMLTSKRWGSLVAAPTFSLPEEIGGVRNWDYRYTWIRDASFTLYALLRLGYTDEASGFMRWIEDRCGELNDDGSLQIMYGIDGRKTLTEETLAHLEGYMGSSPVRIGNGAYGQLQLDIYGELMDSVYIYNKYGEAIHHDLWMNLVRLIEWVCIHWKEPDEGIWEVRGGRQQFLYSRLMCWVAIDRGIRLAQRRSFPAPLDRWTRIRSEIYLDIFKNFWDPKQRAFVQYKGSTTLDAANLLMPMVRFISPTDPRWLSTLAAIGRELVDDALVYRYKVGDAADDGLHGEEGTFSMCSFWYVECLARSGDVERARYYFERMLGYANHLGLYAEELGPSGEHLGNFPQAFTHLALISAAFDLNRRLGKGV